MTALITQPSESRTYDLPMGLGTGRTIASVGATVVAARGLVAEVTPLSATVLASSGEIVQLRIAGGTDGELYRITQSVTDDAGDLVEADVELQVLDLGFVVPEDGQAITYIEPSAYIARFGVDEVVALTDAAGTGRIDRATLNAALADVAAEIDAHLSTRFTVPLSPVPKLIEALAAEMVRARLHGVSAPEIVEKRAEAARRTLRDLAAGRMSLPGVAAKEAAASAPIVEAEDRLFTRKTLEGF